MADRVPIGLRRSAWSRSHHVVGWQVDPAEGRITEDLRSQLVDVVRPDVLRLRALLGEEFDGWDLA